MLVRPARRSAASAGLVALAAVALLAGCSAPAGGGASAAATDTGDGGTSPSAASTAAAASGPDACTLVSETVLTAALGTDPGATSTVDGAVAPSVGDRGYVAAEGALVVKGRPACSSPGRTRRRSTRDRRWRRRSSPGCRP